jgi:UDP-N-acetylglucosamine--N-acetylmuramyl-(pentapeptide) pyrophosphoryl-undecaprenol N-acetylglucosamine transferase
MRILFVAGGTGGHIFPCLAIKKEIERTLERLRLPLKFEALFLISGSVKSVEEELKKNQIKFSKIPEVKFRRYFSLENFLDFFKLPFCFLKSLFYLWISMPDLIFSKGGSSSWIVVLIGYFLGIPIILHESDWEPGWSNRISSIFAKKILTSFKDTSEFFNPKKVVYSGLPLREKFLNPKFEKDLIPLVGDRKTVLFLGGSQGAQLINELLINAILKYTDNFEIIHICGDIHFRELNLLSRGILTKERLKYYHLYPFLEEEKLAFTMLRSDLAVVRGGGGTLFELAALGKPAIILPLEGSANDHQRKNAYFFREKGGAIVLEGENLTPNFLFAKVKDIIQNKKMLAKMSQAMKQLGTQEGTRIALKTIFEYI